MIGFDNPFLLILLIFLPIIMILRPRPKEEFLPFTLDFLRDKKTIPQRRYNLPIYLGLAAIFLFIIAMGNPYWGVKTVEGVDRTRTLRVILDISGSMDTTFGKYRYNEINKDRLTVAADIIDKFFKKMSEAAGAKKITKPKERAGVYLFGDKFYILQVPTFDFDLAGKETIKVASKPYQIFGPSRGTQPLVALNAILNMMLDESFDRLNITKDNQNREKTRIFNAINRSGSEAYRPGIKINNNYLAPANCLMIVTDAKFAEYDIPRVESIFEFLNIANKAGLLNVRVYALIIAEYNDREIKGLSALGGKFKADSEDLLGALFSKIAEQEMTETLTSIVTKKIFLDFYFRCAAYFLFLLALLFGKLVYTTVP